GTYDLTVGVDKPAIQFSAAKQPLSGGVLYDVVVAGNDQNSKLIIAATGLNEQPGSAPSPGGVAVAQATSAATKAAPTKQPPTLEAQPTQAEPPTLAPSPTEEPTQAEPPTEAPTDVPQEPSQTPVPPTKPPAAPQGIIA